MRLTVEQGSDHWRWHFKRPRIFVDDVEVSFVRELDTEAGYVVKAAVGPDGKLLHDKGTFKLERVEGTVSVIEAD